MYAVSAGMPDTLEPCLELDGEVVATSWGLPSPGVRRRHPEAGNGARARFRATGVPARSGVLELLVQDSRTGERTSLATRHLVAPDDPAPRRSSGYWTGSRRCARRASATTRRTPGSGAASAGCRRSTAASSGTRRAYLWTPCSNGPPGSTHRRLRALRDLRRSAGQEMEFDTFWTRLGRVTHPRVLGPHGYQLPLSARDESGCVARDRSSDPPSRRARLRVVREQRHVAGAGRATGRLIAHDDDVDLAVVLAGATVAEVVEAGSPSRTASQRQVCSGSTSRRSSQSHCKLVAAGGLSVDLFPAWTADDRALRMAE